MQKFKDCSEQQLFQEIKNGNEEAIAFLLDQHKNKLYRTSMLLVKDRYIAEDIFQEACIKVFRSIRKGNYIEEGKFVPWAARIVRNLSIDHIRKSKKMIKAKLPDGNDIFEILDLHERNVEEKIVLKESCKTARELLAHLPYEQREVIVLRVYSELSFKEIAGLTNVSINTALGRMRYGLLNLKKMVKQRQLAL